MDQDQKDRDVDADGPSSDASSNSSDHPGTSGTSGLEIQQSGAGGGSSGVTERSDSNDGEQIGTVIAGGKFERANFAKEIHYHHHIHQHGQDRKSSGNEDERQPVLEGAHPSINPNQQVHAQPQASQQDPDYYKRLAEEQALRIQQLESMMPNNPPGSPGQSSSVGHSAQRSQAPQADMRLPYSPGSPHSSGQRSHTGQQPSPGYSPQQQSMQSQGAMPPPASIPGPSQPHGQHTIPCTGRAEPGLFVPAKPPTVPTTGGKQLTSRITAYPEYPLSTDARVYPGVKNMGLDINQPVAVKIVLFSEKKKREAKNLVKLTPHVNVVPILDADILPGDFTRSIYIVMEQCQTMSLEAYYKKRKADKLPFNTKMALEFSRQVVEGINHIHKNGIIHRDLKPSSILFSCDGKNLKIIDFGMSKELKNGLSTMSMTSRKIGTDGFRAPETYISDLIKRMADIFSLAITLYYIWSYGRHPFGDDPSIWSHNIRHYKQMNLGNLLVPDKETALDLLNKMLKEAYRQRIRIADVLDHQYIRTGLPETILHDMEEFWHGDMQMDDQTTLRTVECVLYQRKDRQQKINGQDLELSLSFVPDGGLMKKVLENMGVMPDGYVAMLKDVHCLLRKRLDDGQGNKIGWLDMYKHGEREGAVMIFKPKGYEDLFAVHLDNPDDIIKDMREAMPAEETQTKEPGPSTQTEETQAKLMRTEQPQEPTSSGQRQQPAQPKPEAAPVLQSVDVGDEQREQAPPTRVDDGGAAQTRQDQRQDTGTRQPTEIGQLEFISWWTYNPAQTST